MFLCFLIFFGLLARRKSSDLLGCRYVPVHRKGSWEATEAQPATRSAGKARELDEVYLTLSRYLLNGYVHYAWTYTYYILLLYIYIYIIRIAYVYIIIYTIYTYIYIFLVPPDGPQNGTVKVLSFVLLLSCACGPKNWTARRSHF